MPCGCRRQLAVERGGSGEPDVKDQERVAVGLCPHDPRCADGAAGAAHVLDRDLLTKRLAHRLRGDPGDGVGRPAGGAGSDDIDRPRRIVLRGGGKRKYERSEHRQ